MAGETPRSTKTEASERPGGGPTLASAPDRRPAGADGDWVAIYDLGDEWLHIHVQQPKSRPVAVTTIADIPPYLRT